MDDPPPILPEWVIHDDGSSSALDVAGLQNVIYAAISRDGNGDALLAQELTDSVLHFLAKEVDSPRVRADQLQHITVKVLDQLGHGDIALFLSSQNGLLSAQDTRAKGTHVQSDSATLFHRSGEAVSSLFELRENPEELSRWAAKDTLTQYSLEHVYSPTLAEAHNAGLLDIGGLATPMQISGAVARLDRPKHMGSAFEAMEKSAQYVGELLVLDSPERELAACGLRVADTPLVCHDLELAARCFNMDVILNLGGGSPPEWDRSLFDGPMFSSKSDTTSGRASGHLDAIVDYFLESSTQAGFAVYWHVSDDDFERESSHGRLQSLVRVALRGRAVHFVFDGQSSNACLGPALSRLHSACLQRIGINLTKLIEHSGDNTSPDEFLAKLDGLVKLAFAAGIQRREFLRNSMVKEHPPFLLDRGHLALVPLNLVAVTDRLFGSGRPEPAFEAQIAQHFREIAAHESQKHGLNCIVEDSEYRVSKPAEWAEQLHEGRAGMFQLELNSSSTKAALELLKLGYRTRSVRGIRFAHHSRQERQLTLGSTVDSA